MTVLLNHKPIDATGGWNISFEFRGDCAVTSTASFWKSIFGGIYSTCRVEAQSFATSRPDQWLVSPTKAMVVPVMRSAQRDREFVADLASHRAGLSESQMVGVSGGFCRKLIALLRSRPMAALPLRNCSKLSVQRMRGGTFFRLCAQAHGKITPNRARQPRDLHHLYGLVDICQGICYKIAMSERHVKLFKN